MVQVDSHDEKPKRRNSSKGIGRDWRSRPGDAQSASRARTFCLLVAAFSLVLSACTSNGTDDPSTPDTSVTTSTEATSEEPPETSGPAADTTLVIGDSGEPPNWDFINAPVTSNWISLVRNVVETLVEKGENGEIEPLLAEMTISDDGLQYEFTIREALFHDGTPLDASDVAYSLEAARGSEHALVSTPMTAVETIEVTDENTVTVTLSQPSQNFIEGIAGPSGLIVPEGSLDRLLEGEGPIGTGPFVFGEWRPGVDVTYARFDDYWGEQPYFETVTWRFITEANALISALLAGDIDMIARLTDGFDRLATIEESDDLEVVTLPAPETLFLSMNGELALFDDERVRQAIAHAVDRNTIIDGALNGLAEPTCVYANPKGVEWDSDYCPFPYDPDLAATLLVDASLTDLDLELKHLTQGAHPRMAEIIADMLSQVGVTVRLEGRDLATYIDEVIVQDPPGYEITLLGSPARIDAWVCPGRFTRDCVAEFDDLLLQADAALDREVWASLRRQAVELHADRAFLIPIANQHTVSAMRLDLDGLSPSVDLTSELDLRSLKWED